MTITIADLRSLADALGRFANIRETAKEPEDRILILDNGTVTKFVAGSYERAIVHLAPTFGGGRALVSARLLLGAAKALRGKGDVTFTFDGKGGTTMTTSAGGKVVLPCISTSIPDWPKAIPDGTPISTAAYLPAGALPMLAKFAGSLTAAFGPDDYAHLWVKEDDEQVQIVASDRYTYTDIRVPLLGNPVVGPYLGSVPLDFISALRFEEGPAYLYAHKDMVQIAADDRWYAYTKVGTFSLDNLFVPDSNVTTSVTVNRKELTSAIKAVAPSDGFGRVTIRASDSTIVVSSGEASVTVAAANAGRYGSITFASTKFLKITDALGTTEVTFGFNVEGLAPIAFKEKSIECQVFLAPVVT